MTIRWKNIAIILTDCVLAVYLILAITAFNKPDETHDVCKEVNIQIQDRTIKGFLTADEIKAQLQQKNLYPLGDPMTQIDIRKIEEALSQNPFVESAQCYKTQTGRVHIHLTQRMPVIRVKAANGEDYYVDEHGNIMPNSHFANNMIIATGNIQRKFAQNELTRIGRLLINDPLWNNQVEQLNVLADGTIEMVPRVGDHIVYLGQPVNVESKLNRLEKFYKYGLSKAGWNKYSYISLEFDNQIICKKRQVDYS